MSFLLFLADFMLSFQNSAESRQVFYQAAGYTVERNEPQYCRMRQPASPGADIHLSYHGRHGNISVSYYRPGFRPIRGGSIVFDFGNGDTRAPVRSLYLAAGPENISALLSIDRATLDLWGRSRSVTLRFNDAASTPIETVPLNGSGAAVRNLIACVEGEAAAPAPAPAETLSDSTSASDMTPLGRFRIACVGGSATYMVGTQVIARYPGCESSGQVSQARRFPSGEHILFVLHPVSATFSTGSIVYVRVGARPRLVTIDYLSELDSIAAPNRIRYSVGGVIDINRPMQYWTCEAVIDWSRGAIVSRRRVGGARGPCQ